MKRILLGCIRFYRKYLSSLKGYSSCIYYPTCSQYAVEAIEKYGIRLFATRVQQFGNTAKVYGSAESAFYIDSGYVYSVIAYGIIFTVLVLVLYTILFRYLYQTNEKILYLWVATMLFSSIMNNFLYDIMNNPVLFLIPAAVFGDRTLKKQTE